MATKKKERERPKTVRRSLEAAKAELAVEWDRRLDSLQALDADQRVKASFDAKGRVKHHSKAGSSF